LESEVQKQVSSGHHTLRAGTLSNFAMLSLAHLLTDLLTDLLSYLLSYFTLLSYLGVGREVKVQRLLREAVGVLVGVLLR